MNFKVDTKEKFNSIRIENIDFNDNVADELQDICKNYLNSIVKNIVLNIEMVESMSKTAATKLVSLQQHFYDNHQSFVICGMQQSVENIFDELELLEIMNITPTESEAWDILQMEEIERELLSDEEGD